MIHIRTRVSVPQIQNLDRSEASGGPRCRIFSPTSASSPVEPVRYTTDSRRRMAVYYGARNRPVEWYRRNFRKRPAGATFLQHVWEPSPELAYENEDDRVQGATIVGGLNGEPGWLPWRNQEKPRLW
ncbi:hypothetical protein ALC53_03138 [Atta colombica]|uniref:Uncharacterized protein n=1 Tax=Atta colombica TaxID=520822 RepID=A0A195BR86_9HYME|nr:hypothetical protein ALC53_03138 [Atta colombica]